MGERWVAIGWRCGKEVWRESGPEAALAGGAGAVWKRVWGLREYVYAEMRLFTFCQGSICMIMGILMIERRVEIRIP